MKIVPVDEIRARVRKAIEVEADGKVQRWAEMKDVHGGTLRAFLSGAAKLPGDLIASRMGLVKKVVYIEEEK